MNSSYNHADFIGMCLESDDDYEPYGYHAEMLQAVGSSDSDLEMTDKSIECILFGPNNGYMFHE